MRILSTACAALVSVTIGAAPAIAHNPGEAVFDEAREVEALAANIDTAIKGCGMYLGKNNPNGDQTADPLKNAPLVSRQQQPAELTVLASSLVGEARWYRWFDPHAEIWLAGSFSKPACRIAVSKSDYVGKIVPTLTKLVQVGNFWRPARDDENPFAGTPSTGEPGNHNLVFAADPIAGGRLRPLLMITTPPEGATLTAGQQMLVTVLMLNIQ